MGETMTYTGGCHCGKVRFRGHARLVADSHHLQLLDVRSQWYVTVTRRHFATTSPSAEEYGCLAQPSLGIPRSGATTRTLG